MTEVRAKPARHSYPYSVLDVFTDRPLQGNGLAVVHDADALDDDRMAAFARETRLSETTFVQSPTTDGADYRNRIFTVAGEIPFAGHPSLGTAVAVANARREREITYVQQTGAGLQPVDVRLGDEGGYASVLQEPAIFRAELDVRHVLAAVGLVPGDAHREFPPQVVSTGLETLIAPVASVACVERAEPDLELVETLAERHGFRTFYLVCLREEGSARARMFAKGVVGGEDPATGSAAGPLCAYLAERGWGERVEITQGVEMGRPSRLLAEMEDGRPRVGGDVVRVIEGELLL
jgi:trans-2,3-dihydro-3-hydroxyanthranilate isomerase